jgi:hypothetical protein
MPCTSQVTVKTPQSPNSEAISNQQILYKPSTTNSRDNIADDGQWLTPCCCCQSTPTATQTVSIANTPQNKKFCPLNMTGTKTYLSRQQTDALLLLPAPSALTRQHSKQT